MKDDLYQQTRLLSCLSPSVEISQMRIDTWMTDMCAKVGGPERLLEYASGELSFREAFEPVYLSDENISKFEGKIRGNVALYGLFLNRLHEPREVTCARYRGLDGGLISDWEPIASFNEARVDHYVMRGDQALVEDSYPEHCDCGARLTQSREDGIICPYCDVISSGEE